MGCTAVPKINVELSLRVDGTKNHLVLRQNQPKPSQITQKLPNQIGFGNSLARRVVAHSAPLDQLAVMAVFTQTPP
jgi:hypothetical protein